MSSSFVDANESEKEDLTKTQDLTDIYISVFFDGTGNNIYEQINKSQSLSNKLKQWKKPLISKVTYSSSPTLFSANDLYQDMHKASSSLSNKQDLEKFYVHLQKSKKRMIIMIKTT